MTLPRDDNPPHLYEDNGLTSAQEEKIDFMVMMLARYRTELLALGRHRCYSLATTKMEEAEHWLRARKMEPG